MVSMEKHQHTDFMPHFDPTGWQDWFIIQSALVQAKQPGQDHLKRRSQSASKYCDLLSKTSHSLLWEQICDFHMILKAKQLIFLLYLIDQILPWSISKMLCLHSIKKILHPKQSNQWDTCQSMTSVLLLWVIKKSVWTLLDQNYTATMNIFFPHGLNQRGQTNRCKKHEYVKVYGLIVTH